MPETEETYEDWNMEELREELKARNLHTSGNKDELIVRLEEDDAGEVKDTPVNEEEHKASSTDLVPTEEEGEAPLIDPPRVYSPWELPANTAAAQAFTDAHPESVDPELTLEPERQDLAVANIQDHVDQMAEFGVVVEDPRLEGYTDTPSKTEEAV